MVLAGHAEYPDGAPAIFHQLTALAAGDRITVMASDTIQHFVVVQLISVDYHDLSVVYPTLVPRLTLLTCDIPSYNPQTGIYQARIVIIAEPAAP
jgi:LPXTG-site transpeptidase (sortase) family protein